MSKDNGNKVTGGIPGLVPSKRDAIDTVLRTRDWDTENLRQKIYNDEITVAPDGSRDTTDPIAQLGNPLTSAELIRRLKLCNPGLIFERSINSPDKIGIYVMAWIKEQLSDSPKQERLFICGMESGISPEFSIRHYKTQRVPHPSLDGTEKDVRVFYKETRGWRTVVIRLIKARLVSLEQVLQQFPLSHDSKNWHDYFVGGAIHVRPE